MLCMKLRKKNAVHEAQKKTLCMKGRERRSARSDEKYSVHGVKKGAVHEVKKTTVHEVKTLCMK